MKLNELKKNLNQASKENLIKQISDLFKKNAFVKDYYTIKYDEEQSLAVLARYKDIIENEFLPDRGFGKARLSVAKKAITDFKKLSGNKEQIADIMLYYVEIGVAFTTTYGDIDGPFYTSMEGMYEQAVKYIVDAGLESLFIDRCLDVVNDTKGMGWGFHDGLRITFDDYLSGKNV